MAITTNPSRPTRFKLLKLILIVLFAIVVLVGLTILIVWLSIKPKKLVYYIDNGSIHNYNLSNTNHLNATYNFILVARNPNKRVTIYNDKVDVDVLYDDETIARGNIGSFYQQKRSTTSLKLDLASHDVPLPDHIARNLKVERTLGRVELDVKLKARVRFKVGVWKSRHYRMKVSCEPVILHFFSSSKVFQRTKCDVDF